jgi:hypothetical protein
VGDLFDFSKELEFDFLEALAHDGENLSNYFLVVLADIALLLLRGH